MQIFHKACVERRWGFDIEIILNIVFTFSYEDKYNYYRISGYATALGWYAEFLLKIGLGFFTEENNSKVEFKIDLVTLPTCPGIK